MVRLRHSTKTCRSAWPRAMLVLLLFACSLQASAQAVDSLQWLQGTWRTDADGNGYFEESWSIAKDGSLSGTGGFYSLSGQPMMQEILQIRVVGNHLVYIASVNGQAPVLFTAEARGPQEWVFRNPEHDFPQEIRYKRISDEEINVIVYGIETGETIVDEMKLWKR